MTTETTPNTPGAIKHGPVCGIFHTAIELIGRRWTGAILFALAKSQRRFSDFHEAIPDISDRLLSERLKELEEAGVIAREVSAGRPVQVSYRLTEKGQELRPIMDAIGGWANRWARLEGKIPADAPTDVCPNA